MFCLFLFQKSPTENLEKSTSDDGSPSQITVCCNFSSFSLKIWKGFIIQIHVLCNPFVSSRLYRTNIT